jgi:hypothetical protein
MPSLQEVAAPARNAALHMRDELLAAFGDDLVAIWLYGASIFGPHFIDVDLHVILRRRPDSDELDWLRELDRAITKETGAEIDNWYILEAEARSSNAPHDLRHPDFADKHWSLHRAHWLGGACIVVYGAQPEEIVAAPSWEEISRELHEELREAERHLDSGSPYWVLQLCRVLASLETRDVVRSKLDSADGALERLPDETHDVICAAMRYYRSESKPEDEALIAREYPALYTTVVDALRATG